MTASPLFSTFKGPPYFSFHSMNVASDVEKKQLFTIYLNRVKIFHFRILKDLLAKGASNPYFFIVVASALHFLFTWGGGGGFFWGTP